MADLPDISVIVPVYNVAGYVGPCIASLRAQTYTAIEIVVVDDGSTDGSGDEARAAAGDDPRITVLRQENAGLSAARNAGLREAAGRFVAFVDSDDRVAPTFLETLRRAIAETGAPWAACAVRLVRADGTTRDVSAIHGQRHPATAGIEAMPLATWPQIVPFWPSAWNKLYRRTLIDGTRFVPGTLYEDHPWFQELAARAERIAYVPEPLYWQSQGRDGQITRDGGERVFEQIPVLERCAEIVAASAKPEGRTGLQRIATRLLFERSGVLRDRDRRARFASAGRAFLDRHDLRYAPKWDPAIAHSWGKVMDGSVPVTVVVPSDTAGEGLRRTLQSLARQSLRDVETLIVQVGQSEPVRQDLLALAQTVPGASVLAGPGPGGLAAARNRGLDAAQGHYVVFLDAGDTLQPQTLWLWVEAMLRSGGGLGLSRFRVGGPKGRVHVGTHDGLGAFGEPIGPDSDALPWEDRLDRLTMEPLKIPPHRLLALHPLPSARIFRRGRLIDSAVRFPEGPLSSWHMTLAAAHNARRTVQLDWPGAIQSVAPEDRRLWRAPQEADALRAAVETMAPTLDPVLDPTEWRVTLFARAVWEKLNFADFADDEAKARFEADAARQARALSPDPDPALIDPYIGDRVRRLFSAV